MNQTSATGSSRRMMTAMFLPLFASLLSISIVNVALPAIEESLGAASADLQWVLSGYALAFGMALVPAGRAGDIWGRRGLFMFGVLLFGLASLGAALAMTPLVINIARVFMGFAAGILTPQVIGMIQRLFSGPARGRAYGMMGTVIGVAVAAGPALGGLIIDTTGSDLGWRMTFLINVPVTIIALISIVAWLPKTLDDAEPPAATEMPTPAAEPKPAAEREAAAESGPTAPRGTAEPAEPRAATRGIARLDPLGVVLLSVAVLLLMLPFIQFRGLLGGLFGAAGVGVLVLWALWERRLGRRDADAPMVNLALFTLPSYTLNSLVLGLYFAGMPATWAVVAIYVQQGRGEGALIAGLVTLPSAVMVMLLSARVGRAVELKGPGCWSAEPWPASSRCSSWPERRRSWAPATARSADRRRSGRRRSLPGADHPQRTDAVHAGGPGAHGRRRRRGGADRSAGVHRDRHRGGHRDLLLGQRGRRTSECHRDQLAGDRGADAHLGGGRALRRPSGAAGSP